MATVSRPIAAQGESSSPHKQAVFSAAPRDDADDSKLQHKPLAMGMIQMPRGRSAATLEKDLTDILERLKELTEAVQAGKLTLKGVPREGVAA